MKVVITREEAIKVLTESAAISFGAAFTIPKFYDLPYEITLEMVEEEVQKETEPAEECRADDVLAPDYEAIKEFYEDEAEDGK